MPRIGQTGVLIADDHPDVVHALYALLSAQPDFVPVGTAGTAEELLAAVAATHPDIVLVDWELPGLERRQAVAALRRHGHGPHIVAMSAFVLAARAALAAGADVFISKTDPPDSVMAILRSLLVPADTSPLATGPGAAVGATAARQGRHGW